MIPYKFSVEKNKEFASTLRKRVEAYFKENNLSKNANSGMIIKTLVILCMYLIPYSLIISGIITQTWLLFLTFGFIGLWTAFMGTSVMHDSVHGSYSRKKGVSKLMRFSALLIAVDPNLWHYQHNVLHHMYTNIEHVDEDIAPRYFFRFTPNQPKKWFHRFQHIYALFLYCFSTILWVTFRDFVKIYHYRQIGLIKSQKKFVKNLIYMVFGKIFYLGLFLVLPIIVLPQEWWVVTLMFVTAHAVCGVLLTSIFQLAHVVPDVQFFEPEEEHIEENWLVHQLYTTSNYAMDNKIVSWFVGGLNFQVEHHLFPNICHIHYPKISKIVQKTAQEFNIPYNAQPTFWSAFKQHLLLLKRLGRGENLQMA